MGVPTNLDDLEAAACQLGDSGAHHSYIDEVRNAVAEIKELRALLATQCVPLFHHLEHEKKAEPHEPKP